MRVLVVGSGGREHALVWKLAQSPLLTELHAAPGNPGIAALAECHPIRADDAEALLGLSRSLGIDLVVIGPEVPLVLGLADALRRFGFLVFGPSAAAARIEGSKSFAKEVMAAAGVASAARLAIARPPCVVKEDGLAAGKGVFVCRTQAELDEALHSLQGVGDVVVEELLEGPEVSLFALCDGRGATPLVSAQDFKRAFDGDHGPNTGGMGAYAPVLGVGLDEAAELVRAVHEPVLAELARRDAPFSGLLYAGLMLTADGPKVLEFNCRFGDPETQAILPLLETDLLELLAAAAKGDLGGYSAALATSTAAVTVVLATERYPTDGDRGGEITGVDEAEAGGALVFHAGTARHGDRLVTNGGRILAATGLGEDVDGRSRRGLRRCAADRLSRRSPSLGHRGSGGARRGRERGGASRLLRQEATTGPPTRIAAVIARYARPEMSRVWAEESKLETWLAVELAVLDAWADVGTIPAPSARGIRERARVPSPDRVAELERVTNHDVAAFVDAVSADLGPDGRWFHYGLTSSDVVDTALALTVQAAGELIRAGIDRAVQAVDARAAEHRGTITIGRTHGVHAEPTTFGLKLLGWAFQLERDRGRLDHALAGMRVGKLSGAVGTYATTTPEMERIACEALGLEPAPSSTQILQRDRHAEILTALAVLASSLDRFALEIRHLARTEVREVEEPFGSGQKGSSAMPHKRNPIVSERICGLARLVRGYAIVGLENVALWHERDISHSSAERVVLPDAFLAVDYMLDRFAWLVEGLVVRPERMRANLETTGGLFFSQRLLLALVESGLDRDAAYRMVQRHAMRAWDEGLDFRALVRSDAEIAARVDLGAVFDLAAYTRHVDDVFARRISQPVAEEARA